jgi:hypothetical protein
MKNIYIKINDIADIDTSKISVYDLNKRFVDKKGNIFSLRYDKILKKIEILKIIRADSNEAALHQINILKSKKQNTSFNKNSETKDPNSADDGESSSNEDEFDEDSFEKAVSNFNSDKFIKDTIELMITHKNRLKGIETNIKNSNIVLKTNKHENSELDEIFRGIDIEGGQNIDKIENYQKELLSYPRSITYYQSKIDKNYSHMIDAFKSDAERMMKFIYSYEMYQTIKNLYTNLNKVIKKLKEFLLSRDQEVIKNKTPGERQAFNDAQVSLNNTISEIENVLDELKILDAFIINPNNFSI